jgi:hypothetical protein
MQSERSSFEKFKEVDPRLLRNYEGCLSVATANDSRITVGLYFRANLPLK